MSRDRFIAWVTGRAPKGSTIPEIIAAVAAETGISARAIASEARTLKVSAARQEVMRRAYSTGRYSLYAIGQALGRDHTTVAHGVRRAQARLCA
jgi:chromosomal replication initiation ATPase DnaA